MSSDHFSPWSERQGESGFAWSFLGAALATTQLPFGVVNAPGQRYHPAIIAQAIATLAQMFPGRFWAALGSGEASNERVTGEVVAAQGGARPAPHRMRRRHPAAAGGRGGQPRRARARQPRPAVDAARHRARPRRPGRHPARPRPATPRGRTAWSPSTSRRRRCRRSWTPTARPAAVGLPGCRSTSAGRRPTTRPLAIAHDQWRSNVFGPPVVLGPRDGRGLRRHRRGRVAPSR